MSYHIAILGAGISGLATAWFLRHQFGPDIHLTLIEKNQQVGGWIQTCQIDNFLFEQGPRSCRTKGAGRETLALIESLSLQNQILTPHTDAQVRYIYQGKRLQRLPSRLWEIPFNPLTYNWLSAFWQDWRMSKSQQEDESIQSFFSRRLGKSWSENLIEPIVLGIYAGDYRKLSIRSCFPLFDQWEREHGSLLRGAWYHQPQTLPQSPFIKKTCSSPLFSFREGMGP